MAIGSAVIITNLTSGELSFTNVSAVNDDAVFAHAPGGEPATVGVGENFLIAMANSSAPVAPKGVGFSLLMFAGDKNGKMYLDIPAVGSHSWKNTKEWDLKIDNPQGNFYTVVVTDKK